jgi:hypothetical protein
MKRKAAGVTTPTQYIAALTDPRQGEIRRLHRLIRATVPDLKPFMISGMIGYGPFRYRYPSGREGDGARIALASRKQYISLYACAADARGYVAERYRKELPKADIGKSCVRFKRLEDVDLEVLKALLRETARTPFGM